MQEGVGGREKHCLASLLVRALIPFSGRCPHDLRDLTTYLRGGIGGGRRGSSLGNSGLRLRRKVKTCVGSPEDYLIVENSSTKDGTLAPQETPMVPDSSPVLEGELLTGD